MSILVMEFKKKKTIGDSLILLIKLNFFWIGLIKIKLSQLILI